jgi:hypothetical protein
MLTLIQIVAVAFATFAVSRAILRAKDKKIKTWELFFWLGIWGVLVSVVFFPTLTSKLANLAGIGRGTDAIVYSSIGLLFYMTFRLYVKLEENEIEITRLVREIAIFEKNSKKKK